ncbi:hypothetical protein BKA64DRAFT_178321 [Cadophora sp. MPI-SDFR-AT-0126]|nr:hypothetical protein BKA64DRAFT_178321 [Leotiomycetes sp. MPI-SDFR-AT-0126]
MSTPALNASIVSPKGPPSSSKQLTIFVTTHVSPSDIEKFKEAHRPVWKKCSEEPECLLFEVLQDSEVKGRFRFVEVWSKSREWFEKEQMSKPYYETLWEKSKPLWTQDIQIEYFEREGEGFSWSDEYLIGGKRMEKDEVVV